MRLKLLNSAPMRWVSRSPKITQARAQDSRISRPQAPCATIATSTVSARRCPPLRACVRVCKAAESLCWSSLISGCEALAHEARSPQPHTLSPKPQTLNPKPQTLNPKLHTLDHRPTLSFWRLTRLWRFAGCTSAQDWFVIEDLGRYPGQGIPTGFRV